MDRPMSFILWIITVVRMAIVIILASIGIITILATGFRMVFQPLQGDFIRIAIWMAKPLGVAIILLAAAYLISKTLTRSQKFIIATIVFLISGMVLYSAVSGMDWTASLQAQYPTIIGPPVNVAKQVNTLLQNVTGI
jgi:hypothetical protein